MATPHPPTSDPHTTMTGVCPVQYGSSIATADRIPLYTPEFVADPHHAYDEMRRKYGTLVPIELAPGVPATLVIGYATAVRILNDATHFPADPRIWQKTVPEDCPVLPMMAWFPAARYNDGPIHTRYRDASVASIDGVDVHGLPSIIEEIAIPLINTFCKAGTANLVTQYAFPLVLDVLNHMIGCPPEIGQRVASGMAARFDTVRSTQGMAMLKEALLELIQLKRDHPGDDVTSRLAHHPAALDDIEIFAQLMSFYGAGFEAQRNLITNALLLMITDDRFKCADVLGRNLSTITAIDEVLFNDPPMANFCTTYPRQPIMVDDIWLPADQPVVISLTGCNNDPEIRGTHEADGTRLGNRSHLAWSAGPHACPAKGVAYLTVQYAIDQLFDALPDIQLGIPEDQLVWRPGPFHRAMVAFPVIFTPATPMKIM